MRARQPGHGKRSASASPVVANDPAAVADLGEQDRRRPRGRRSRRPARRGRGRRADETRAPRVRPECRRGAARGFEGVDEGRARRRGRADRRATARSARARNRRRSRSSTALPRPYVVKTDGLAAGKGVLVTDSLAEARDAVRAYLSGAAFGDAGRTCVIEEALSGPELSLFALCDGTRRGSDRRRAGPQARVRRRHGPEHGRHGRVLAGARSSRRLGRRRDDGTRRSADARASSRARGAPFRGALYCGLMLTPTTAPRCSSTTCASATPSARC